MNREVIYVKLIKQVLRLALLTALIGLLSYTYQVLAQSADSGTAERSLKHGDYNQALTGFQQALAANPKDVTAQKGLLETFLETGHYNDAVESANKFLALKAGNEAELYLALGEGESSLGRYQDALGAFQKAADSSPRPETKTRAIVRRAETATTLGQEDLAQQLLQSVVTYYQDHPSRSVEQLTILAQALTQLERFHEANDVYLEAIQVDPTNLDTQLSGGELFTSKYAYADAAQFYQDAQKINPNSARLYLDLALNKRLDGGPEFTAALNHALEINPNLVDARLLKVAVSLDAERYTEAGSELDLAFKTNPNSLEAHSLRAALFMLQDRKAEYEAEVKATLALSPHYGGLYDTLATYATQTRHYAQGVEFARQAIAIAPKLWQAHLDLGMGLLRLGKMTEGRTEVEVAFKGDPFNVWSKNTLDLLDSMRDYRETTVGPFIIKADAKESDALTAYAGELVSEASQTLTAKYKFTPQTPIAIEIFHNHDDFAVRTLGLPGLGALGVCFGQVVALDSPSARPLGEFNWGSTLWHEYTHVITLQMTDYNIPRWFSEGLSVYEERRGRPGWGQGWSITTLQAFADHKWFGIADLDAAFMRPKSPDQVPLAYFEASQICEFITDRYGFPAILEMLKGYREKRPTSEILQQVLKLSEAGFDQAFNKYISDKMQKYALALAFSSEHRLDVNATLDDLRPLTREHGDDFAINLRLATLYKKAGKVEEAKIHLKHAIELFPFYVGPDNAYEQLAETYEQQGQPAAAKEALENLIKYSEDNLPALTHLTQLRLAAGDKEGALAALRLSFFVYPLEAAPHTQAGNLYFELGDQGSISHAINEYRVALALKPSNPSDAYYNLARAYMAAGNKAEAKRAVLRSLEAAPGFDKAQELLLKLQ